MSVKKCKAYGKKRTKEVKQAEYELRLLSKELYRRYKRGGKKRFKDFMDYLTNVHKIDPDRASIINAQAEKDLAKQRKIKKKRQISPEIAARLQDAGTGAERVEIMYNDTEAEAERIAKSNRSLVNVYKKLKTLGVDVSGNLKKLLLQKGGKQGRMAVIDHDLIRGARAKAGRLLDKASKEIYEGLTKDEERLLDRIITSRRVITIEGYKPDIDQPYDLTAEEHQEYLNTLPEQLRNNLNERADMYFEVMRQQLDNLRDAGIITAKEHQSLAEKGDYSPRNFLKFLDPDLIDVGGGKKISVPDSGIRALKQGDFGLLDINSRRLLHQVITRTQTRIMRNNANGSLYAMAKDNPDNGIVKIFKGDEAPPGFEKIQVMIDGNKKTMIMPSDLAQEWVETDPAVDAAVGNMFGWVSGTKILKAMATGFNPEFALTNIPRDIAHIWLTTEEYSPNMFVAAPQLMADLWAVKGDAWGRKGSWDSYVDQGGGMETLTKQGLFDPNLSGGRPMLFGATNIQNVAGYIGESSELWTRLALRNRALRNLKKQGITGPEAEKEATWIARNYLDFAQGGNAVKAADTVIPYLNASIQGTRGIARAAATNPKAFGWKVAQLGVLAMGLYLANTLRHKDAWDDVRDRDKVNNWIFTTPWSYIDKNGDRRHLYFKIAKDQGQRVFATLFESLMAKFMGDKVDGDQIAQSILDFIPMLPSQSLPPLFDAWLGYAANKDFWAMEDIWRGAEVPPEREYTKYTHPFFVDVGKVTGMSPDRTRYALQQYFTYGNIWTSMIDWGSYPIYRHLSPSQRDEVTQDFIRRQPGIRRVLRATDPVGKFEKEADERKRQEAGRRLDQRDKLDELADNWLNQGTAESKQKMMKFVRDQNPLDRKRLIDRIKYNRAVHQLPDKRWWLLIKSATPEVRARLYWSRFRAAGEREKKRLQSNLRRLPGIASPRFRRELSKLKKGSATATLPE